MSDTEVDRQPETVTEKYDDPAAESVETVEIVETSGTVELGEPGESADVRRGHATRSTLIVVPLLLGLLVVAGIGARMLLADIPDRAVADDPGEVVCWDGSTRPEAECEAPTGRAGLRWMFPSFKPAELGCRDVLPEFPKSTRPAMFECRVHVSAGSATVIYSQLTSTERGRQFLEEAFGSRPEELDDDLGRRLMWTEGDKAGDGSYDLAVMYAELPFAVEVSARSAEARDEALERLVRFRPEDDAIVRPEDAVVS